MTRNISTATARRPLVSALTALILAAALPQAALAATDDGFWRVDPAKSGVSGDTATLTIERAGMANPATGSFIVISKGSVYRVTRAIAADSKGVTPVDYAHMSDGKAVLIGMNAHAAETCGFRCQLGLPDNRPMTLTFKAVAGAGQQINEMLANNAPKQ